MTLFKQIMLLITALLFILLLVVFGINFNVSKSFVQNELYERAKNSANSLSLSLGKVSDDVFLMETTIAAMFDGGHFQRISMRDAEGKLLIQRKQALTMEGIPPLFIQLISMEAPAAESVVTNGWNIVGTLEIQGHTGPAYARVWDIFKNILLAFSLLWIGSVSIASLLLKAVLHPIYHIRKQAEAIEANHFIINPRIPSTPELNKVVVQMNKMVETVQKNYQRSIETIKEARRLQYEDKVSGLYNKAYFVHRIQSYLNSQEHLSQGCTALVSIQEFETLKLKQGFEISERLIRQIASILKENVSHIPNHVVTRLSPNEYALILPGTTSETVEKMLSTILLEMERLEELSTWDAKPVWLSAAVTPYAFGDTSSQILSNLDYALAQAKGDQKNPIVATEPMPTPPMGREEWKRSIEGALESDQFILSLQAVLNAENQIFHHEAYISMEGDQGQEQAAGVFMPMALELGIAKQIDRYVISKIAKILRQDETKGISINISTDFVRDRECLIWIREFLSQNKELAHRLAFEFSETTLNRYPKLSIDFAGLITGTGFNCGIDNFSISEESLILLQELRPLYIKVDHPHICDPSDAPETQITLKSLLNITESLDIKLIGCKIESSDQVKMMTEKGITYFQGNHLSPRQRLESHGN